MRRYLVIAHKTLGGAHLMDHLHALREQDPYCRFHLVVPEHHPRGHWNEGETRANAERTLAEMLDRMASMGIGATGEVGDPNPVYAVSVALRGEDHRHVAGIILSTLPKGISRWWRFDVPRRMAEAYPSIPVTHLVSEEALVAS